METPPARRRTGRNDPSADLAALLERGISPAERAPALSAWAPSLPAELLTRAYCEARALLRPSRGEAGLDRIAADYEGLLFDEIRRRARPLDETGRQLQEQRDRILLLELPSLEAFKDRDIEEYFKLRTKNQPGPAKQVYGRLAERYPEAESRACLLRWWRTGHPLFGAHYFQRRRELADGLIAGIQNTVLALVSCFRTVDGKNPVALLDAIRAALRFLPPAKDMALRLLERLARHAQALDYHAAAMESAARLLGEYFGETLFERPSVKIVISQDDDSGKAAPKALTASLDVRKVRFTPADLKEILIPDSIQGLELQTLAYCRQYWTRVTDAVFESKILLYSQKYKTFHYAVFSVIKRSLLERAADEVVLYRALGAVGRGLGHYDYNVKRDLMMQRLWARIKPGAPQPKEKVEDPRRAAEEKARAAMERRKQKSESASLEAKKKLERLAQAKERAAEAARRTQADESARRDAAREKARQQLEAQAERRRAAAQDKKPRSLVPSAPVSTSWVPFDDADAQGPSLRERLDAMDTTEQRNLVLIFRRRIEGTIDEFLDRFTREAGVEAKPYNRSLALLAVKDFILSNLDNPRRNWTLSRQRLEARDLGYSIADVEPIIESCLKALEDEIAAPV